MEEIISIQNQKVKNWGKLHQKKYRTEMGLFLVEEEHMIEEALKANCVEVLLVRDVDQFDIPKGVEAYLVNDAVLHKLSNNVSQVSCIAICHKPQVERKEMQPFILLDAIQDPGNMGTLLRSALAFGYDVVLGEGCVDVFSAKTLRSSQGAFFHLHMEEANLLDKIKELKAKDYVIYGTAFEGATPLQEVRLMKTFGIVLGNEGQGVQPEVLAACNELVKIEMKTFDSLNVGVAGSICMYEMGGK